MANKDERKAWLDGVTKKLSLKPFGARGKIIKHSGEIEKLLAGIAKDTELAEVGKQFQGAYDTCLKDAAELAGSNPKKIKEDDIAKKLEQIREGLEGVYATNREKTKARREETSKNTKEQAQQLKKKAVCVLRLAELQAKYNEIATLPGIDEIQKQYKDSIAEVKTAIEGANGELKATPDYISGVNKLDAVDKKKLPDPKECAEKSALEVKGKARGRQGRKLVDELKTIAPEGIVAPLEGAFNTNLGLVLSGDNKGGPALEGTLQSLEKTIALYRQSAEELESLHSQVINLFGNFKETGETKEVAYFQVQIDRFAMAQTAKDFPGALKQGQALCRQLEAATKRPTWSAPFQDKFQKRHDEVKNAIAALKNPDAAKGFALELEAIGQRWLSKSRGAYAEDELSSMLEGSLGELTKLLSQLKDPTAIKKAGDEAILQKNKQQFETDWKFAVKAIEEIEPLDGEASMDLLVKAENIRKNAASDYAAARVALDKLNQEIEKAAKAANEDITSKKEAVTEMARQVLEWLEALKKFERSKEENKALAPVFDALETERAGLALLAGSGNRGTLADALEKLTELKNRLRLLGHVKSQLGLDRLSATLANNEKQLNEHRDEFKEFCPAVLKPLDEALAQLQSSLGKTDPADYMKELGAFEMSFLSATDRVTESKKAHDEFKVLFKAVDQTLDAFPFKKVAPSYLTRLEKKLKQLKTLEEDPLKRHSALADLKLLQTEIENVSASMTMAVSKEDELLHGKDETRLGKAEWTGRLSVFNKSILPPAKDSVSKAKGDKGLISDIEKMVKAAEKTAKSGDYQGALRQLDVATKRAEEAVANPHGYSIGARNNLVNDDKVYQKAVGDFNTALANFLALCEGAVDTLPSKEEIKNAVKKRLKTNIERLQSLFAPQQFTVTVRTLSNPELKGNDLRGQREPALAQVRSIRGLLSANPLLTSIASNPFDKRGITMATRRLDAAINRLEANILRLR